MTPKCVVNLWVAGLLASWAFDVSLNAQQGSSKTAPSQSPARAVPAVKAADPFELIAADLSKLMHDKSGVSVGIGNFAFENTDLLSPFSALLRDELEIALGRLGNFKVVTRDRIADLQNEGKFQARDLLEPGTAVSKVSVEGIQGIVRGRFYASPDAVSVFAELVWLEGGTVQKCKVEVPTAKIRARLWPDRPDAPKGLESIVRPQNLEASVANVQELTNGKLKQVAKDFPVELYTTDTKRAYQEGEVVSFRLRSDRDCYVAVYCHQSDGSSVLLFPNHWQKNAFVSAGKAIDIPGTHKHGFEIQIGPPFGSDVVQAIVCTSEQELLRVIGSDLQTATASQPFVTMTRGMAAVGISSASTSQTSGAAGPVKWSESHLVVSTFPK
jgi:hypothetical protein